MRNLILFLVLFVLGSQASVNLLYGNIDEFSVTEEVPVLLPSVYIRNLGYPDTDVPSTNKFDYEAQNTAIVVKVSGIAPTENLDKARIDFKVKGHSDEPKNDGFGLFWDDDIPIKTTNNYKAVSPAYKKKFSDIPNLSSYQSGTIATITFWLGDSQVLYGVNQGKKIKDMIKERGYFYFVVSDDTTVDYVRFINEDNIVAFTCNNYTSTYALSYGLEVHSYPGTPDRISSWVDNTTYSFKNSILIATASADKNKQTSVFKYKIDSKTRFFLFRRTADAPTPSNANTDWVVAGGWTLVIGASISLKTMSGTTITNSQHSVYTKVYDGPTWVVFGPPAHTSNPNPGMMYFVSYIPVTTLTKPPSNPSGSCDCSSTGDPHYTNFDNGRFDLYRSGAHHLVKSRDCSFDVQTYMYAYKYGGYDVSVNGILSVRYLENAVTLARAQANYPNSWTGDPTVRLNGVTQTASFNATGMQVTKTGSSPYLWTIKLTNVGLTVTAQSAGSWYTINAQISDPHYQTTVDGLCGNCDGYLDYRSPQCDQIITNPSSKLSSTDAWTWGGYWTVKDGELVADPTKLTLTTTGKSSYQQCLASPLIPDCSPKPPEDSPPGTEPLPPADFARCDGNTPVPPTNDTPPDEPPPDVPPPSFCEDDPNYAAIKQRCIDCATQHHYPTDDCIVDICLSGKPPSDYMCPSSDCVPGTVTNIISKVSYKYASLDNVNYNLTSTDMNCQDILFSLPSGWEIAPPTSEAQSVSKEQNWNTRCMTTSDGVSWETKEVAPADYGTCPKSGNLIKRSDGCYITNHCDSRILIRKANTPVCGNGIKEDGEQCDDGNKVGLDGCTSDCKTEWDHYCDTTTTPNLCTPTNNVVEEHECDLDIDGCVGCEVTEENKNLKKCCDCSLPCCD